MFGQCENRRYSELTTAKSENPNTQAQQPILGYKYLQNDHISSSLINLSPFIQPNPAPSFNHYSTATMTLIETPAPHSRSTYLDQLEEGIKSITRAIVWANEKYHPDSSDLGLGDSQYDSLSSELNYSQRGEAGENLFEPTNKRPEQKTMEPHLKFLMFPQPSQNNFVDILNDHGKKKSGPRKGCNCKKSQCLKLYCDCFRENKKCQGCACIGCHNTQQFKMERDNAKIILMDRNPQAFKPKIESRSHAIGCNCKKTSCQKRYCECYQSGLACGVNCKCEGCKNYEPNACKITDKKTRQNIPVNFKLKTKMGPSIIVPVTKSTNKEPTGFIDNK